MVCFSKAPAKFQIHRYSYKTVGGVAHSVPMVIHFNGIPYST